MHRASLLRRRLAAAGAGGPRRPSSDLKPRRAPTRSSSFRLFYAATPTPLWIEDFSALKRRLDSLAEPPDGGGGPSRFVPSPEALGALERRLRSEPGEIRALAESVRILSVNEAVLELLGAKDRSVLLGGLAAGFDEDSYDFFLDEILHIARGDRRFDFEVRARAYDGRVLRLLMQWMAAPGHESSLDRVYVSAIDITARAEAEEELRRRLAEKEALLREIHHRIGNNLTVVDSLLGLHEDRAGGGASAIAAARGRIDAMAIVHDALYAEADLGEVSLEAAVCAVARGASLGPDGRGPELAAACVDLRLPIDRALPLGLVVHELVSNCARHAYGGEGREGRQGPIRVLVEPRSGDRLALVVEDEGRGLPAGFDPRTERGLGYTLCRVLAGQLGGELRAGAGPKGGARVELEFPAAAR